MRGVYTCTQEIATLTTGKTLMYITAPSTQAVEIMRVSVSDATDATNEQREVKLANISALGTPTASTVTPTPIEKGDQAAGSTVKGNVTASEPTYGTDIMREGFASVNGWVYEPQPDQRPIIQPGASVGLKMITTCTTHTCKVVTTIREIG